VSVTTRGEGEGENLICFFQKNIVTFFENVGVTILKTTWQQNVNL
jgi:hypothetical protein